MDPGFSFLEPWAEISERLRRYSKLTHYLRQTPCRRSQGDPEGDRVAHVTVQYEFENTGSGGDAGGQVRKRDLVNWAVFCNNITFNMIAAQVTPVSISGLNVKQVNFLLPILSDYRRLEQGQVAFLCNSQLLEKFSSRHEFGAECFQVRCQHLDVNPIQAPFL